MITYPLIILHADDAGIQRSDAARLPSQGTVPLDKSLRHDPEHQIPTIWRTSMGSRPDQLSGRSACRHDLHASGHLTPS
jgi:hypothetical protein